MKLRLGSKQASRKRCKHDRAPIRYIVLQFNQHISDWRAQQQAVEERQREPTRLRPTYRLVKHEAKHCALLQRALRRVDCRRRHFHALLSHFLRRTSSERTANAPCLEARRAFGGLVRQVFQLHVHWSYGLRSRRRAASCERCPRGGCTPGGSPAQRAASRERGASASLATDPIAGDFGRKRALESPPSLL